MMPEVNERLLKCLKPLRIELGVDFGSEPSGLAGMNTEEGKLVECDRI